eukprot:Nitzschia sp. Nitz4//scaffold3_size479765//108948//109484//NITZ4_000044-RA/size479765-processed-gene-0.93-mRNA-1//-1//CDS//3329550590//4096//frame0
MTQTWTTLLFTVFGASTLLLAATTELCSDHGISKGETLLDDCTSVCSAEANVSTFDWAHVNEDDSNQVDRTTVCRCTVGNNTEFECFETTTNVWDLSVGVLECSEYNITSGTTCKDFCLDIDPVAYSYAGTGDSLECYCGADDFVAVCDNSGASMHSWISIVGAMSSGLSLVLLLSVM